MGEFGYNYQVYVISPECGLVKVSRDTEENCVVCRMKIKTKTLFIPDELFYCENEIDKTEFYKAYCHSCVKKLTIRKEMHST